MYMHLYLNMFLVRIYLTIVKGLQTIYKAIKNEMPLKREKTNKTQ